MQGQVINGFILKRQLGHGGMAEVWYAENEIGKPAAVKILNENLSNYQQIVERFHNEALVMVKLDHPNIRQVYGYGYIGNRQCIVMEYLEGDDLDALMKCGRHFTDEELHRWWNQTVDALNYTHAMGIVHRDIKPSNLFLDKRGNIKLLDFGIAKVKESISMTQTGALMGTLMYMSPEQVKDTKNIDYRTDVYSLAVTFAQLVSGNCPYDSTTSGDFEIRERIVYKPLDLSDLPTNWKVFLTPYLEKEPENRPALRHFEVVMPMTETPTMLSDSLTKTVAIETKGVAGPARKPQQQAMDANPTVFSVHETPKADTVTKKPKKKVGLWIGIGAAALVILVAAVVLFMKLREKSIQTETDNKAYKACVTANDYRAYMHTFGSEAMHYKEAKDEIERLVADSTAKALQAITEEQAKQQAEAEARAKAEAEQKEYESYNECTTVAACDNYLKDYPQGRYVTEVEARKAELKKAAEQAAAKKEQDAKKAAEKKQAEAAAKKEQERKKESKNTKPLKLKTNKEQSNSKLKIKHGK